MNFLKKTITDFNLRGKKVIIRCDFNVPIKDGIITDDNRLVASLDTINYAINEGAKVILMSHLGRVKSEEDKAKNSLKPVSSRLSELLNKEVIFVPVTHGPQLEEAISGLQDGDVLLMENTRFEDVSDKKESSNDLELGKYWASLGEIFINDAFGTSHRAHASNVGIASNLPSGVGFLVQKEIEILGKTMNNPRRPFVVILGGSKVEDKIGVIDNLVKSADVILIGGGMAFTFLKAKGYETGKSLLDEENIDFCKNVLKQNPSKIILPIDVICAKDMEEKSLNHNCLASEINSGEIGLDIGPKTIEVFGNILKTAKTVIWNGPLGMYEVKPYDNGTKAICEILTNIDATKIAGGGDVVAAISSLGYGDSFTHMSTGGGASLELLEGKSLKGIDIISE